MLDLTRDQAAALVNALSTGDDEVRAFIAMRYWHPMSDETATEVTKFAPDEVILLPLYPQFSTTTTGSSLDDWRRAAAAAWHHSAECGGWLLPHRGRHGRGASGGD